MYTDSSDQLHVAACVATRHLPFKDWRHSWNNGSSFKSWLPNWCPPEAPFSEPQHHRVGKMPSREADQLTWDSRDTVHGQVSSVAIVLSIKTNSTVRKIPVLCMYIIATTYQPCLCNLHCPATAFSSSLICTCDVQNCTSHQSKLKQLLSAYNQRYELEVYA